MQTILLRDYTVTRELRRGADTILYQGYRSADHTPVTVKLLRSEYPSLREVAKIRHEYAIIKDLDVAGVARGYDLEKHGNGVALVMAELQGEPLSDLMRVRRIDLRAVLEIGIAIAGTLESIHRHHIIHKDVKPPHVFVHGEMHEVKLTGFGIATRLSQETQKARSPGALEGDLSYMSPEQTGRMNRVIDYRTDLYSLGVTLYEMLTGVLPFQTTDPTELVHSHIARRPAPAHELAPEVPRVVSDIVSKLLAKAAEDRYQSARGLKADLTYCLAELAATGEVAPLPLCRHDVVSELRIPQRLYGRAGELSALLSAVDRASAGATELLLLSGNAGVGKSALVNEAQRAILQRLGYFISGKFEELGRSDPYSAVARAFGELLRHLLTESAASLARWRGELLAALGPNGRVLIDVIPEVELVIGPQPAVQELGPTESQNRFNLVFQNFVRLFTRPEHPLVIFLDDLQWADPASLRLIHILLTDPERDYLLVIGAYRDGEVDAARPVHDAARKIEEAGVAVSEIALKPLGVEEVDELCADALATTKEAVRPLAELVLAKTGGNPFFLGQFLIALAEEKLLTIDATSGSWSWDLGRLKEATITDNVIAFMAEKIQRLTPGTQRVLKLASCIGHQFDLRTLSFISERSPTEIASDLWEALKEGLVVPLDTEYRYVHGLGDHDAAAGADFDVVYRFLHDRVQHAAYSLIEEDHRQAMHLQIGRLLRARSARQAREEDVLAVVHHLNLAVALITAPAERLDLVQLDLAAGRKARSAMAYHAAAAYLRIGMSLLGEASWEEQRELTYQIHVLGAECEYLSGHVEEAEALFTAASSRVRSTLAQAEIQNLRSILFATSGRFLEALRAGCVGLSLLGIDIPETEEQRGALLGAEIGQVEANLAGRRIPDLIDAPALTNPAHGVALKLLMNQVAPAYHGSPSLFPLVVLKQVNISLKHGHSEVSAYSYMVYGLILAEVLGGGGRYKEAYELGKLALALHERFGGVELTCKLNFTFGVFTRLITPLRSTRAYLVQSQKAGLHSGDLTFMAYAAYVGAIGRVLMGDEVGAIREEADAGLALLQRAPDPLSIACLTLVKQMMASLEGRTESLRSLSDEGFDETAYLQELDGKGFSFASCWYYTIKLELAFLDEDHEGAVAMALEAEQRIVGNRAVYMDVDLFFFSCLALLARRPAVTGVEREQHAAWLARDREKIASWSVSCPENFLHQHLLIAAEEARLAGDGAEAMRLYDPAIRAAGEQGFVQHQALANELAARFHLGEGRERVARAYMMEALAGYRAWGASAKVAQLTAKHAALLGPRHAGETPPEPGAPSIDLLTVIKASQALSGEINLDRLMSRLMTIVIENAGAERGCLIRGEGDALHVEAEVSVDSREVKLFRPGEAPAAGRLPVSILHYTKRTAERVILDDASVETMFADDAYVARRKPRSVMCLPLVRQTAIIGLLYLENNLTAGAFTKERQSVLDLLTSQAAISLENATLYAEVTALNAELEQRVADRTAQLELANRELEAFSYSVSHDLKAPLRAIDGFSRALEEDCLDKLDPEAQENLAQVRQASRRMGELIEDLLGLSHVTSREMRRQEVDLSELARGVVAALRKAEPEREVECIIADSVTANGDPQLLRIALENLLGNAWKYTRKHARARIEFGVAAQPDGRRAYFVRDDGAGFDMKHAEKLFTPFKRLHDAADFAGTGVGLATVHRIVSRHGGRIWAESAVERGCTFYMTL